MGIQIAHAVVPSIYHTDPTSCSSTCSDVQVPCHNHVQVMFVALKVWLLNLVPGPVENKKTVGTYGDMMVYPSTKFIKKKKKKN